MQEKGDERILGSGAFVTQLLSEVDLAKKYRLANIDREKAAFDLVEQYCQENGISSQALILCHLFYATLGLFFPGYRYFFASCNR
jgi:hypothetical protein